MHPATVIPSRLLLDRPAGPVLVTLTGMSRTPLSPAAAASVLGGLVVLALLTPVFPADAVATAAAPGDGSPAATARVRAAARAGDVEPTPPEPVPPPTAGRQGRFGWPLPGAGWPTVARAFDAPENRYAPGHRGVDLAAEQGTPVLAAGGGTVVFAGTVAGRGVVSVDHPGGLRTTYEPVAPLVTAGMLVAAGEPIGTLRAGHPGCPVATCLHWGVRRGADYLDPLWLLGLGRVRLLPWDGADHAAGTTTTAR